MPRRFLVAFMAFACASVVGACSSSSSGAAGSPGDDALPIDAADSSALAETSPLADAPASDDASTHDAGAFDVASLEGLALWLDAAKGAAPNGSGVFHWADQSSSAFDPTSAGSTTAPTVIGDAIDGRPAVRFLSSDYVSATRFVLIPYAPRPFVFGAKDFLVEIVAKIPEPAGPFVETILVGEPSTFLFGPSPSSSTGIQTHIEFSKGAALLAATNGTKNLADGAPHLIGARRTISGATATIELRVDGASDATKSDPAFAADLTPADTYFAGGQVAEIVVVLGSIAPSDLSALESHLRSKYGL